MQLNFREWLMSENTVSQYLKDPERFEPELIQAGMKIIRQSISAYQWFAELPEERTNALAKWLFFLQLKTTGLTGKLTYEKHAHFVGIRERNTINTGTGLVLPSSQPYRITLRNNILPDIIDYMAFALQHQWHIIRSKLNNPDYTLEQAKQESRTWHDQLAVSKRKPAAEGREVPLSGMPKGWKWVSLDKDYCEKEGNSMGHCGNSSGLQGDNIYSLRDNKNIPHLTFIVNNGELGESKGYGNNKPEEKYHPQIVALLLGEDNNKPIVNYIKGGGYLEENNFRFDDLSHAWRQKILSAKPHINDKTKYFIHKYGEEGGQLINWEKAHKHEFLGIRDGKAIVHKETDISDMMEWLRTNTDSQVDSQGRFQKKTWGNFVFWSKVRHPDEISYIFEELADDHNRKTMKEIGNILGKLEYLEAGKEIEDDQDFDMSVEDIINGHGVTFKVLRDAGNSAYDDAVNVDLIQWFEGNGDKLHYGYSLEEHNGNVELLIPISKLKNLTWNPKLTIGVTIRFDFPPEVTDLHNGIMSDYSYNTDIRDELTIIRDNLEEHLREVRNEV